MINTSEYIRLIAFLKRFDCNNREAATYITCLQKGTSSIQEIATEMNTNRITIHSNVNQLIQKGLLFETRKGKKRYIVADPPDVLSRILQKKMNELKLIENELELSTKLLNSLQSDDQNSQKIRLYEGQDSFKKTMEEMIKSKNELYIFSCYEDFDKNISSNYLGDFYKRLSEAGVQSKIICSSTSIYTSLKDDQIKFKLQIRTFKTAPECHSTFYLWNDNIALKSLKDDKTICTILQNYDLSLLFRNIVFETMWNTAKSLN